MSESPLPIRDLLARDHCREREGLDRRYAVLDEVLAGSRQAVIYPAARLGRLAAKGLSSVGARIVAFGDGDPALHGLRVDGLPILSPDDVASTHGGDAILVASTMHDSAIRAALHARGCANVVPIGYLNLRLPDIFRTREYEGAWAAAADPANQASIEEAYGLLADEESRRVFLGRLGFYLTLDKEWLEDARSAETIYFDPAIYELTAKEVVVDGGAYVGDTLDQFLDACSGGFAAYYAFEPDRVSFAKLAAVASADPDRIVAVNAGLSRSTRDSRLFGTAGADSRMLSDDEPGGETVPVICLDEFFRERPAPTLIKMDIEGAEESALLGAHRLLLEARPTLAISAYHFPTDMWALPLLIERLMPGSRIHLRHYGDEVDDTVCYAVSRA